MGLLWGSTALAGPPAPLSEDEVVRRALANPALAEVLEARLREADARVRQSGRWPNPRLSYMREQIVGSGSNSEDYVTLQQAFDLGGYRWLERRAAKGRANARALDNARTRVDLAARVRGAYARALYAQERLGLLEAWRGRVEAAVAVATDRVAAGDAPRLHVERVRRELQVVDARMAGARADRVSAWSEVRALMTGETDVVPPTLAGPLLPASDAPGGTVADSPQVRALSAEVEAARTGARAARRAAVPPVSVSLGYKGVEPGAGAARQQGFTAGVSIPIPLGDRGQVQRRDAEASLGEARGERALLLQRLEAREAALVTRRDQLRAGVSAGSAGSTADVSELAELAYRGGEIGAMELLDAHRSAFAARMAVLDLSLEIREVRIELDRIHGRTTP